MAHPQGDRVDPAMTYTDAESDVLGLATLEAAKQDLGVKETEPNWGPRIEEYLATVGIAEPAPWCAAALSTWIVEAEDVIGMKGPTVATPGAKALGDQFKKADRWMAPWSALRHDIKPGMIAVFDRGMPGAEWRGHVGVVSLVGPDFFLAIEGNATAKGDQVAEVKHTRDDHTLLGFGVLSGPVPRRPVLPFLLMTAAAVTGAIYLARTRPRTRRARR
jgi:hypothetical protein